MRYSITQDSHIGGRRLNEDSVGHVSTERSLLLVVADGMGGHPKGEVASKLAMGVVFDLFRAKAQPELPDVALFLQDALMQANEALVRYARTEGLSDSPRTTLVAAVIQDGRITWIHCGDSRFYLLRDGAVFAKTLDHSLLERDRQLGRPPASQLPGYRNALFTCIGSETRPVFNLAGPVALRGGDRVLLCSDGIWSVVEDANLAHALLGKKIKQAVPQLVQQAIRLGGPNGDNASCIALAWGDEDDFLPTSRHDFAASHGQGRAIGRA